MKKLLVLPLSVLLVSCVPYVNDAPQIMCGTDTSIPIRASDSYCDGGDTKEPGQYRYFAADPAKISKADDVLVGKEVPAVYLDRQR